MCLQKTVIIKHIGIQVFLIQVIIQSCFRVYIYPVSGSLEFTRILTIFGQVVHPCFDILPGVVFTGIELAVQVSMHPLQPVSLFRTIDRTLETKIIIIIDMKPVAFLRLLCSHKYYTESGTRTIDSGRSSIFQHRNTFDIFGIQHIDIPRNIIYQHQRTTAIDGSRTTNIE